MEWNVLFFVNSVLLGVGLTMDAFSVSLANGLNEPKMRKKKMCGVAGVYAFFQALMPMTGWICVHTIVQYFRMFEKFIPWIALILLLYIGGKMLWDGFRNDEEEEKPGVGAWALFVQGVGQHRLMRCPLDLQLQNMTFLWRLSVPWSLLP